MKLEYHIHLKDSKEWEYSFSKEILKNKNIEYILKRAENSIWENPGEIVIKVIDNGSYLKFDSPMKKSIDYGEFGEY